MRMPDFNAPECDCPYLESLSKDPAAPVEFDVTFNEYHILGTNGSRHMVYHCPFCGGRAPKSRRHELFTPIAHAERERLKDLTRNLKTVTDVTNAFGPPDSDNPAGYSVTKEDDTGRPRTTHYRALTYKGLSAVADVEFLVGVNDQVWFTLMPKSIDGA